MLKKSVITKQEEGTYYKGMRKNYGAKFIGRKWN